jgi:hypothetical protein
MTTDFEMASCTTPTPPPPQLTEIELLQKRIEELKGRENMN